MTTTEVVLLSIVGILTIFCLVLIAISSPKWLTRAVWRESYRRGYLAGKHREQRRVEKLYHAQLLAADRTHMPREDSNAPARVSNIQIHRGHQLP